jgi:predicted Zn-dependent protease
MLNLKNTSIYILVFSLFLALNTKATETITEKLSATASKTIDIAAEQKRIQNMFNAFITTIGKSPKDYTIEVVESKDINAFATLGRRIVVNTELIKTVNSESALAMVLAHELGHLERKHLIKSLISQNSSALIKHYIFKDNRIVSAISYAGGLHYSRETEKDADMFGINLINKLYCNVPGKLEFFEKMSKLENAGKLQEYFSTHPLSSSRLDYLSAEIKAKGCLL